MKIKQACGNMIFTDNLVAGEAVASHGEEVQAGQQQRVVPVKRIIVADRILAALPAAEAIQIVVDVVYPRRMFRVRFAALRAQLEAQRLLRPDETVRFRH